MTWELNRKWLLLSTRFDMLYFIQLDGWAHYNFFPSLLSVESFCWEGNFPYPCREWHYATPQLKKIYFDKFFFFPFVTTVCIATWIPDVSNFPYWTIRFHFQLIVFQAPSNPTATSKRKQIHVLNSSLQQIIWQIGPWLRYAQDIKWLPTDMRQRLLH